MGVAQRRRQLLPGCLHACRYGDGGCLDASVLPCSFTIGRQPSSKWCHTYQEVVPQQGAALLLSLLLMLFLCYC